MILQGRDIQPKPSEKVRSPENNFESQKTRHELIRGGLCFTRQASILHAECLCQKGFQSSERLFQNLDEQNITKQGVDIENICHHLFQGQYVKQKGFNVDNLFDRKGIHVGSIM